MSELFPLLPVLRGRIVCLVVDGECFRSRLFSLSFWLVDAVDTVPLCPAVELPLCPDSHSLLSLA